MTRLALTRRAELLQNVLSNDVRDLARVRALHAAALSPHGRISAAVLLYGTPDNDAVLCMAWKQPIGKAPFPVPMLAMACTKRQGSMYVVVNICTTNALRSAYVLIH